MKESKREKESKKVNVSKEVCMIINNVNDIKGGNVEKLVNAYYQIRYGYTTDKYVPGDYLKVIPKNWFDLNDKCIKGLQQELMLWELIENKVNAKTKIASMFITEIEKVSGFKETQLRKHVRVYNKVINAKDIYDNDETQEVIDAFIKFINVTKQAKVNRIQEMHFENTNGIVTRIHTEFLKIGVYNKGTDMLSKKIQKLVQKDVYKKLIQLINDVEIEKAHQVCEKLNNDINSYAESFEYGFESLAPSIQKEFIELINTYNGDKAEINYINDFINNKITWKEAIAIAESKK